MSFLLSLRLAVTVEDKAENKKPNNKRPCTFRNLGPQSSAFEPKPCLRDSCARGYSGRHAVLLRSFPLRTHCSSVRDEQVTRAKKFACRFSLNAAFFSPFFLLFLDRSQPAFFGFPFASTPLHRCLSCVALPCHSPVPSAVGRDGRYSTSGSHHCLPSGNAAPHSAPLACQWLLSATADSNAAREIHSRSTPHPLLLAPLSFNSNSPDTGRAPLSCCYPLLIRQAASLRGRMCSSEVSAGRPYPSGRIETDSIGSFVRGLQRGGYRTDLSAWV